MRLNNLATVNILAANLEGVRDALSTITSSGFRFEMDGTAQLTAATLVRITDQVIWDLQHQEKALTDRLTMLGVNTESYPEKPACGYAEARLAA